MFNNNLNTVRFKKFRKKAIDHIYGDLVKGHTFSQTIAWMGTVIPTAQKRVNR